MFLEDFIKFAKFVFVSVVFSFFVVLAAVGFTAAFETYTCGKYEEVTGASTKYAGLTCYIKTEKGYMSYKKYIVRNYINHSEWSGL